MKINKTYLEVILFSNIGSAYLEKHKENENKLCFSIRSVMKQVKDLIEEYNEAIVENNLDHCSVDEKGIIRKDDKGALMYTVEGQKAINKFRKDILKKTVEVHTRIRPENDALIKELTSDEVETFADIVITKPKEE